MIATSASLRSDFIHIVGMAIHIAPECTNHITGIRTERLKTLATPEIGFKREEPLSFVTPALPVASALLVLLCWCCSASAALLETAADMRDAGHEARPTFEKQNGDLQSGKRYAF